MELFESFYNHAWLSRVYARLTVAEHVLAMNFLIEHKATPKGEFEAALNHWFLDQEKPKHFAELLELLLCANSKLP